MTPLLLYDMLSQKQNEVPFQGLHAQLMDNYGKLPSERPS